ncbi:MAG: hypothetical protein GY953_11110 [bacterium]|nr:hypothetical protein [bacterium]
MQREAPRPAATSEPALKWEQVTSNRNQEVIRAKVPGGWLVAVGGAGLTFYPDPAHNWNPGSNSPGA